MNLQVLRQVACTIDERLRDETLLAIALAVSRQDWVLGELGAPGDDCRHQSVKEAGPCE